MIQASPLCRQLITHYLAVGVSISRKVLYGLLVEMDLSKDGLEKGDHHLNPVVVLEPGFYRYWCEFATLHPSCGINVKFTEVSSMEVSVPYLVLIIRTNSSATAKSSDVMWPKFVLYARETSVCVGGHLMRPHSIP